MKRRELFAAALALPAAALATPAHVPAAYKKTLLSLSGSIPLHRGFTFVFSAKTSYLQQTSTKDARVFVPIPEGITPVAAYAYWAPPRSRQLERVDVRVVRDESGGAWAAFEGDAHRVGGNLGAIVVKSAVFA